MANKYDKVPAEVILFSPIKIPSSRICLFCLKKQPSSLSINEIQSKQKLLQRFLKISERYFKVGKNDSLGEVTKWLISNDDEDGSCEFLKNNLDTCDDCSLLLQDFCDIYNEISILQMKLNWKVNTLQTIMTTANKVSSRVKELKDTCRKNVFDAVKEFRLEIVRKALRKSKSSFPKIHLPKVLTKQKAQVNTKNVEDFNCLVDQNLNTESDPIEFKEVNLDCKLHGAQEPLDYSSVEISQPFLCKQDEDKTNEATIKNEINTKESVSVKHEKDDDVISSLRSPSPSKPSSEVCSSDDVSLGHLTNDEDLISTKLNSAGMEFPHKVSKTNQNLLEQNKDILDHNDRIPAEPIVLTQPTLDLDSSPSSDFEEPLERHLNKTEFDRLNEVEENDDDPPEHSSTSLSHSKADGKRETAQNLFGSDCDKEARSRGELKLEENTDGRIPTESNKNLEKKSIAERVTRSSQRVLTANVNKSLSTKILNYPHPEVDKPMPKLTHKLPLKSHEIRKVVPQHDFKFVQDSEHNFTTLKKLALKKAMELRFICNLPPCNSLTFMNVQNYKRHQLYHGNFKCNFCDIVKDYAPDLSDHEIRKHSQGSSILTGKEGRNCSRCKFHERALNITVKHHLNTHLNLELDRLTCPICDVRIQHANADTETKILEHYSTSHDLSNMNYESIRRCDMESCRAYFRTSNQLVIHKKVIHGHSLDQSDKTFYCDLSKKYFSEKKSLQNHQEAVHFIKKKAAVTKHHCKECGKYFAENRYLQNHINAKHSKTIKWIQSLNLSPVALKIIGRPVYCKISECRKLFYNQADLKNHSKLHGKYKCNFCDVVLTYARDLFAHELTHSNEEETKGLLVCPRCTFSIESGKRGKTTPQLVVNHFVESHLNLAMDDFTCHLCDIPIRGGNQKHRYKDHLKELHDFSKTIYTCDESGCIAYFNKEYSLKLHQRKYHEEEVSNSIDTPDGKKRYLCKQCGKTFKKLNYLKAHEKKLHINFDLEDTSTPQEKASDGIFPCKECDRTFSSEVSLRNHFRIHDANRKPDKPWVCETCGKSFKHEDHLKRHHLSHSGPESWEFICSQCRKRCLTEQKLAEHQRTHTKETPFSCEVCGISYAHRHNLRIHINSKHSDVTSDLARSTKSHLTSKNGMKSRQGTKRKPEHDSDPGKLLKRPKKRHRRCSFSSSDTEIDGSDADKN